MDRRPDNSQSVSAVDSGFDSLQNLVNGFSHDIGAPLRAVVQFSRLLAEESSDRFNEEERYWLQLIQDNGEKAQAMIAALRRYSLLDRLNGSKVSLSLRPLLDSVLAQKADAIKASSARIDIVGDFPDVTGDINYWHLFFECLIDNALLFQKKTEDQVPIIKIDAKRVNGCLQICVEDNGIGVSESQWDVISAPFKRLHRDKDYPGLGMGLAFCERIARIHGGIISFDHSSLDGFAVTFIESTDF